MEKNRPQIFFFSLEEGISIRNYLRNSIKMVPMLYNDDFRRKLLIFVVKKWKNSHIQEYVVILVAAFVETVGAEREMNS